MKKLFSACFVFILMFSIVLSGCGSSSSKGTGSEANSNTPAATPPAATTTPDGPVTINQSLPDKEILSKGPNGESAISAKTLKLTPEELAKIKEGKYKAAVALHYAGNDWSTAQVKGLKDTFAKMGIEVIAQTDANFKPEKQVSDIETILTKKNRTSSSVFPLILSPPQKRLKKLLPRA